MLNRTKPQAPLLAVPFRWTTQGHGPRSTESRESCQFVNPDYFDSSEGAEGVMKLTTPLGKSPACDVVRLCFVVCVSVSVCCVCCVCVCVCVCCVCVGVDCELNLRNETSGETSLPPHSYIFTSFAEVDEKTRLVDETPKTNVCKIRTRI